MCVHDQNLIQQFIISVINLIVFALEVNQTKRQSLFYKRREKITKIYFTST